MTWFYVSGSDRKGPVEQPEFDRLAQSGVIAADTLVWREGMADWQPYKEVAAISTTSPLGLADRTVQCSECGGTFPADQTIRLDNRAVCANCKPIALQKVREGIVGSGAEQIRQAHLKHEASVQSVGVLYFLSAALLLVMGSLTLFVGARGAVVGAFFLVFGVAMVWVGIGLRKLKSWARIPSGILSGIGLLGFPLGTLINGYILYLLFSEKGKMVFSDEYKQVIAETPHLKYRTSIVVWIFLVILIALIGFGMVGLFLGRAGR